MYLLKLEQPKQDVTIFVNSHSTMYLLKPLYTVRYIQTA